jgi:hypothetical protein
MRWKARCSYPTTLFVFALIAVDVLAPQNKILPRHISGCITDNPPSKVSDLSNGNMQIISQLQKFAAVRIACGAVTGLKLKKVSGCFREIYIHNLTQQSVSDGYISCGGDSRHRRASYNILFYTVY